MIRRIVGFFAGFWKSWEEANREINEAQREGWKTRGIK